MVVHYGSSYVCALASMIHKLVLIHFSPMFHFYTPLEKSENQRFFYPFQGYGNRTSVISDSTLLMKAREIPHQKSRTILAN